MLRATTDQPVLSASGLRFAIVASRYNRTYTDALVKHATTALLKAGATRSDVRVVRVPGAFEIPLVVNRLARCSRFDVIIALGVVIRGETAHADLIAEAITTELMRASICHDVPVVHEVLVVQNEQQAHVRCLPPKHNRGTEAALTAIEMGRLLSEL